MKLIVEKRKKNKIEIYFLWSRKTIQCCGKAKQRKTHQQDIQNKSLIFNKILIQDRNKSSSSDSFRPDQLKMLLSNNVFHRISKTFQTIKLSNYFKLLKIEELSMLPVAKNSKTFELRSFPHVSHMLDFLGWDAGFLVILDFQLVVS